MTSTILHGILTIRYPYSPLFTTNDDHLQIGPDTYLMASRGPSFNSRVRDYRRNIFGDGAPLVKQGFLGVRNQEVTVKERRRYRNPETLKI